MSAERVKFKMSRGMFRLMITLSVMLLMLLAIGLFLYLRVNRLLNVYMEEQGKKQAETISEVTSRQFEGELKALSTVASEFTKVEEVSVDALRAMQESDHESRIGVQRVDGNPYYGVPYGAETFACIEDAIHGEQAISYVQGKGLMFCVPAFRDRNVAYVIYRIYPESQLYSHFGVASYSGMGRVMIMDRDGHVVIPTRPESTAEKMLFDDDNVEGGFQELMQELFTTGSAATFRSTEEDEVLLFAAEIESSEFYLKGYVPRDVVQEGVKYVEMLVLLVFGVLAGLVFLGGFLLSRLEIRAQESEHLRAASLVAEKSNAAKSDFLANMSHEIRTPINAMLGMNEMILRESGDERVRTYAGNIDSAGKNLLSIINDILDFSKIEAGKMEITDAPYQLSTLLIDVSNMIMFRAQSKNLQFFVDVDETLPDGLYGDEVRIRQVLVNVLTNAVKYTNEGSVKLSVSGMLYETETEDQIHLLFTIEDTGIGIKEDDIKKLFNKFERVDLSQNKTVEGTGLGLAITQSILSLMGGEISVESEYGKGSTFTIILPQNIVSNETVGNFHARFKNGRKELQSYRESFRAPDADILVVDDTAINLTVIEGLLKQTEIRIDTALSGEEALKYTLKKSYDLVLMDQRMPKMDGMEALQHIREQEGGQNRETPVIALTADAVQGAKSRYLQAGFADYLSKPVDGNTLEAMIMKYLPEEKVIRTQFNTGSDGQLLTVYEKSPGLSYADAIQYLGTDELLKITLGQFYLDINENADAIESYVKNADYENYTIKVHALKSSARLIGANALSADAKQLEDAGNRITEDIKNGKNVDAQAQMLHVKTQKLLADYRAYTEVLKPYFQNEAENEVTEYYPEISRDELNEMYAAISEFTETFDIDSIDSLMQQLNEYSIPGDEQQRINALKSAVRNSDWEKMAEIVSSRV
ncbi:MAG: response regulator [Lachnospiraceae bacterium]|nr:response regulator [Lachnospiraceae bacterium]